MAEQQSDRRPTEITIGAIKKHRISISIGGIMALGAAMWGGHGWVDTHVDRFFVTEVEASELQRQVKDAADTAKTAATIAQQTSTALFDYIKAQQLKESRDQLATLRGQLQDTLLWESQNGENELSRARKRDLETRIRAREAQVSCLEAGRQNCVL